jgi:hypothetical protein
VTPLLLAVLLCAGAPAAAGAGDGAGQPGGPAGAALEALRGHPKRARALLSHKDDPAALVVLASIALDGGDAAETRRLAARIEAAAPGAAEGRLLDALARERIARPRNDWVSAAVSALRDAQPIPSSKPLLDLWGRLAADYADGRFPEDAAKKLSVADRFLARWAWLLASWAGPARPGKNPILVEEAVRVGQADERPLVLLAAVEVLASAEYHEAETVRPEDVGSARQAATAKLRGIPTERLRFLAVATRTESQPIDEEEIAAIEASTAGDGPSSYAQHYMELLRILEQLDPVVAPKVAHNAAFRLLLPATWIPAIEERSMTGKLSGAGRDRLGAALVRLSDRERREGLIFTDALAAIHLAEASRLRNDPSLRARAEALRSEVDVLRNVARCFNPLDELPIRSMQRAFAEQRPQERALMQQAARRGLSCPEPDTKLDAGERSDTDAR